MNHLDLFSGIGGFSLGLQQAGVETDYIGFSDIDPHANKTFKRRFPDAEELGSVTDIQCEQLPKNIDILCGGFPCQSFSIAGLRGGFEDTRGTLFFEIVRILRHYNDSGGGGSPVLYSKMLKVYLATMMEEHLLSFTEFLPTLITPLSANCLILVGFYPKIESGFTLSDILEENPDPKYFLSEKQVSSLTSGNQQSKLLQHSNHQEMLVETIKE